MRRLLLSVTWSGCVWLCNRQRGGIARIAATVPGAAIFGGGFHKCSGAAGLHCPVSRLPRQPRRRRSTFGPTRSSSRSCGTSYVMGLVGYKAIGQPATVDIELSRIGTRDAGQDYEYFLKPGGVGFTANLTTLKTAIWSPAGRSRPARSTSPTRRSRAHRSRRSARCVTAPDLTTSPTRAVRSRSRRLALRPAPFLRQRDGEADDCQHRLRPGMQARGDGGVSYICLGPTVLRTVATTGAPGRRSAYTGPRRVSKRRSTRPPSRAP